MDEHYEELLRKHLRMKSFLDTLYSLEGDTSIHLSEEESSILFKWIDKDRRVYVSFDGDHNFYVLHFYDGRRMYTFSEIFEGLSDPALSRILVDFMQGLKIPSLN